MLGCPLNSTLRHQAVLGQWGHLVYRVGNHLNHSCFLTIHLRLFNFCFTQFCLKYLRKILTLIILLLLSFPEFFICFPQFYQKKKSIASLPSLFLVMKTVNQKINQKTDMSNMRLVNTGATSLLKKIKCPYFQLKINMK